MNENCPQVTFAEQPPAIIAKYGRKTNRLKQALVEIAFKSAWEAGAIPLPELLWRGLSVLA